MDSKYTVNILASAEADLHNIYKYITQSLFADKTAIDIITQLKNNIFSLDIMPSRYSLVNDSFLAKKGYRRIVVKNYVVLYLIDESVRTVNISRIFHGSMNYAKYI